MKSFLLLIGLFLLCLSSPGQRLGNGTYVFEYCDIEYNSCVGTCKVVIKKDSIIIYATKVLSERITFTKEGDVIERGLILKHKSGKWIIGQSPKDKNAEQIGVEGPPIIDFRKKQYWTF